ncbi:hypothetical protein EP227_07140 [bacterium]|nr:MAG: hypothetical protein EP227_07140 [bacterium]
MKMTDLPCVESMPLNELGAARAEQSSEHTVVYLWKRNFVPHASRRIQYVFKVRYQPPILSTFGAVHVFIFSRSGT